jgi:threonine/homoserine/homoserine lactone efflux protein
MPEFNMLLAFIAASLVLAVTPGPVVLYVVARSLAQGRGAGMVSVAGGAVGNLGNAIAAALGLSALFAASALAFEAVKLLGAAYLIHLGIRHLRHASRRQADMPCTPEPLARVFRDAVLVSLLNPKTTLFFAAFLPQFMNPGLPAMPQSLALGALFVGIALVTDSLYALAAGTLAPSLKDGGRFALGRRVLGLFLIGLGLFTALTGTQHRTKP